MSKRIAVKDLHAECIESKPIDADWSTGADFEGYGDGEHGWQFWEAQTCESCNTVMVFHMGNSGGCSHTDADSTSECDGYFRSAEGPMMNYWYPVSLRDVGDAEEAARRIADLPLCVVNVNGATGLALTGGGMDLSWEICEAFTRLGQLPPTHFADLSAMADRLQPANSIYGARSLGRDRYIVSACRKALTVQMGWLKSRMRKLRSLEAR